MNRKNRWDNFSCWCDVNGHKPDTCDYSQTKIRHKHLSDTNQTDMITPIEHLFLNEWQEKDLLQTLLFTRFSF